MPLPGLRRGDEAPWPKMAAAVAGRTSLWAGFSDGFLLSFFFVVTAHLIGAITRISLRLTRLPDAIHWRARECSKADQKCHKNFQEFWIVACSEIPRTP
jgi:hypothetical protein